ncbi:hypothetical protein FHX82_001077 [Amycolatopsis bartoniae]|uniref:Uncharacterized protein n=1 Tax=Amycolatopsis bartoniae TaxID=941986 RepID=A0A8H9J6N7_9PSEU|nr:hypothetical protein [Amycolatopsis bartoniae]GHF84641.1 hypothetical protein GCM10017566_68420 [Amycolatopsis bartoniae]
MGAPALTPQRGHGLEFVRSVIASRTVLAVTLVLVNFSRTAGQAVAATAAIASAMVRTSASVHTYGGIA